MPRPHPALLTLLAIASVVGCGAHNPHAVPPNASLVGQTPPATSFAPNRAGVLFVVDRATGLVIFSAAVDVNQAVTTDPASGHLSIGGQVAAGVSLAPTGAYEFYFKPTTRREYHPAYNP